MNLREKNPVKVFTVKKKHAWRDQFLRYIGLGLILLVVVGTVFWLLFAANFSFEEFFSKAIAKLKPEIKNQVTTKVLTKEEQLKETIVQDKVFEIEALSTTAEGDYLVKAKDGLQVFFSSTKNFADQVRTLQTLLTKARIDNKALKKVDFRFEKIVVEY